MNTPLLQAAMGIEEDVMSGWRGEEREGRVGGGRRHKGICITLISK